MLTYSIREVSLDILKTNWTRTSWKVQQQKNYFFTLKRLCCKFFYANCCFCILLNSRVVEASALNCIVFQFLLFVEIKNISRVLLVHFKLHLMDSKIIFLFYIWFYMINYYILIYHSNNSEFCMNSKINFVCAFMQSQLKFITIDI